MQHGPRSAICPSARWAPWSRASRPAGRTPTTITTASETGPAVPETAPPGDDWRVVIAHDFAETFGGAERVLAVIAEIFPRAPVWAIAGRRQVARRIGIESRFHTLLPESQSLLRHYRGLAPLYPALVAARRLPEADLLITSSYAFAHGFRTRNAAPSLCYCYSPLRFAWSMTDEYASRKGAGRLGEAALRGLASPMRALDRRAARRVTRFLAESRYVAEQIERFYGRPADVLWPPVDCERFTPAPEPGHDGYFLFCSRLIEPYKRPTLAVEAFRDLPERRLVIAADGPALPRLRQIAPDNVDFVDAGDDARLVGLMQRCAAVIFPSRDDFGLIPVETMACGRPAIAYGAGGALETVVPGVTGELFAEQSAPALIEAVRRFDADRYDPGAIRAHAERWDTRRFKAELLDAARQTVASR